MMSSLVVESTTGLGALAASALSVFLPLMAVVLVIWAVVAWWKMRTEIRTLRAEIVRLREENGTYVVLDRVAEAPEETKGAPALLDDDVSGFRHVA